MASKVLKRTMFGMLVIPLVLQIAAAVTIETAMWIEDKIKERKLRGY